MNDIKCPKCGETFKVDQAGYADIANQIRNREFEKDVQEKLEQVKSAKDNEFLVAQANKALEIAELKSSLEKKDLENEIALAKAVSEVEVKKNEELRLKEEELEKYKDYKLKLSTKMIGESLEQHCEDEFNKVRATGFAGAYFEKDNDASSGSKGDFIFKDFDQDSNEFVSIMFEMKNESEATANKKKNEEFFKELDKDRNEKGCEYAVLVSLLEAESDLYNMGIVDVSYRYPKMYVVRPEFFIPIITLIRNGSLSAASYKAELARVKAENIDITNFQSNLDNFQKALARNYDLASSKLLEAIAGIDKTMAQLEKTKQALLAVDRNYRLALEKAEDVSIKKLTRGNPTMAAKFKELPALAQIVDEADEEEL